jgi:hypothetical protein
VDRPQTIIATRSHARSTPVVRAGAARLVALLAAVVPLANSGCEKDCWDYCACDCFDGCSGDERVNNGLRTYTDEDGCPCCECYVIARYVCAEGCFLIGGSFGGRATCGEDIPDACGNGVLDEYEQCDPGMAADECTESYCAVPGVWQDCNRDCTRRYPRICEFPQEVCGNGIDEDCDGATDERCP